VLWNLEYIFFFILIILIILIILVCGRLLVDCWSLVGLFVGRFVGRFICVTLIILIIYNGYERKSAGRFGGYLVGRF
jgi:hypothetical protein